MNENLDLKLAPGGTLPALGLGTWKSAPGEAAAAVAYALTHAGYRHIDCAAVYGNEKEIGETFGKVFGEGIRTREEVFITSKLWNADHKREAVLKACEKTLSDLQLSYLDLYLMHWGIAIPSADGPVSNLSGPAGQYDENGVLITEKVPLRETWEAMEELVEAGLVKAIGVANFTVPMLIDLLSYAKVPVAVNQIELHPYLQQDDLIAFCTKHGIAVTAYSPLGSPGNFGSNLLEDETIVRIAKEHGKQPSHVILRWGMQRGTAVIPKSVKPARIDENAALFDFELTPSDMEDIAKLDRHQRFVDPKNFWKIPYFA